MKGPPRSVTGDDDATIRDTAARWIVRLDRRLTTEEAAALRTWLDQDPRHAAAFARSSHTWGKFQELGRVVRQAPVAPSRSWAPAASLRPVAIAAGLTILLAGGALLKRFGMPHTESAAVAATSGGVAVRHFADGSIALLRPGAELSATFTPAERRVQLVRGEAFFTVAKDNVRPFYVNASGVTVRAVGTAFSVRFDAAAIDVLVTEGTVHVNAAAPNDRPSLPLAAAPAAAVVSAGKRAIVPQGTEARSGTVIVSAVSADDIARALAWKEPMMELAGATLGELVAAFAERSGRRIEIADPQLRLVRIGGRFPTNDVDGFVRAIAEVYDVEAERRNDGSVILRRAK